MDNLQPVQSDNWKPRTLWEILTDNRGFAGDPPPADPPPQDPPQDPPPQDPPPADPPPTDPPEAKWFDDLPEDLKSHPKIQEFKGKDGLAKSYLELHSLLGHEKVALPKDENDKVAIEKLNEALGVPKEVGGYELEEPEPIPGMEAAQFPMDEFSALAHKHNLTNAQAKGLLADYTAMLAQGRQQAEAAYVKQAEETANGLKKDWGLAYDSNVKVAQAVMNKYAGGKEEFDHINALIGTDPVALKWLAKVGSQFKEGSLGDVGNPQGGFTKTPAEAKTEYDKIMSDSEDIYWAGVRNTKMVPENIRKERISYVESLLKMQLAGQA